ncbi:OmpP1/FadL family transporter [Salinarimonas soli]|nr:outer membrane protein transport protein [Salinarimonas soli]
MFSIRRLIAAATVSGVTLIAAATVSGVTLIAAGAAQASSFYIRTGQGAEGVGLQFAGGASGGIGLASIGWNPATMTMFPGRQSNWNAALIYPQASYSIDAPSRLYPAGAPAGFTLPNPQQTPVGEIGGEGVVVPSSYSVYQVTDQLWVGLATGAPWGLRSKAENLNSAGQVYGRSSKVRSYNASPSVAYQVTPWLSLGAAAQIQYFKVELKQASPFLGQTGPLAALTAVSPNAPSSILEGFDVSYGYRLGATITPWTGGTFGIGYRSMVRHELSGDLTQPTTLGTGVDIPIRANLTLPESVLLGFSQQITPDLQVHLGYEWTNWSRFSRIPVRSTANDQVLTSLNFEYSDAHYFSAGLEYAFNPFLTLRGGVSYEQSAVTDRVRTTRISDNDRWGVSAGVGYKLSNRFAVDVSYAHYFIKDAPVNIVPGHPSFSGVSYQGVAKPSVDVLAVGLTYRWDEPAVVAVEERPLIRKF